MIRSRLNQYNPCAPVFFYSHRLQGFHPVISFSPGRKSGKDSRQGPVDPPGHRVFVLAAIGNPLQFLRDLEDLGLEISGRILPRDHHPYSQQDLDQAAVAFLNSGAEFMVTTEKDAVRLRHLDLRDIPLYSIGLELFSSEENRFREWLLERLPELS